MDFSELALLVLGITTVLPVIFYMLHQKAYSSNHALWICRNLATYVVITVSSFTIKIGPDIWAGIVAFFKA